MASKTRDRTESLYCYATCKSDGGSLQLFNRNPTRVNDLVKHSYVLPAWAFEVFGFSLRSPPPPPRPSLPPPLPLKPRKICVHSCRPARWRGSKRKREGVGRWKPRQGCHSAGQSLALHMSTSSTHNSNTQWDKRWRIGRSTHTHTHITFCSHPPPPSSIPHLPLHLPLSSL